MTKLTKTVRSTIREVVEKHCDAGSADMRAIAVAVARDILRDEHGIRVRLARLLRIAERV